MSDTESRGGCPERHDDLAAYALGALDPGEAAELERHLAGCPACSERVLWLRPAADLVPASVRQVEPPASLRAGLMATVRAEAGAEAEAAAEQESRKEHIGPLARVHEWLFGEGSLRPALAGFAAVCLLVAAIGGYEIGHSGGGSPQPKTFAALPTSPNSAANGTVQVSGNSGTLTVSNMHAIPKSQVYQAWVAKGSKIEPSSVFVVDGSGRGSASIPSIPAGADRVMVTREPAGGSRQPSTAPVLTAEL